MDKPFFRLVGAPCGQHGQYTFYKALRVTGKRERIIAIGDFFFIRIWQDSELVSIGELQLLWTDRVSDQTLVSLRLYFLPENTPDGRSQHGEDEVLAINDKVVVKAEDLMSWMCEGEEWRWGLRAVWRGSCAPPADTKPTQPLHNTKLDFSDVENEKNSIASDAESPGVVVFSYPRYCRYRALVARLEGIQADWLRDSLVAALGGYSAPSNNTRILYCKDTFEYPELEGHEFVCNHLAPRLKGRPRGRRRRAPRSRSRSRSRSSRSTDSDRGFQHHSDPDTPRRISLRNGASGKHSEEEDTPEKKPDETTEDKAFLVTLKHFYKDRGESFKGHALKDCSLRWLYWSVVSRGGYGAVCRRRLWSTVCAHSPSAARNLYERFLLPYENHERRKGALFKYNGKLVEEPHTIDTIEVSDSPLREVDVRTELPEKRLRTPSPRIEPKANIDNETGECKEDVVTKSAETLNREFLESLPKEEEKTDKTMKISVKPVEKLLEAKDPLGNTKETAANNISDAGKPTLANNHPNNYFTDMAYKFNMESRDAMRSHRDMCSVIPAHALTTAAAVASAGASVLNGYSAPRPAAAPPATTELVPGALHRAASATGTTAGAARPLGRSSLRAVRVKPARPHNTIQHNTSPAPPLRPDSASSSPPTATPQPPGPAAPVLLTVPQPTGATGITNFGIHRPPQPTRNHHQQHSDDEIVEVPYRPNSPEIIDVDEYDEGCGRNEHSAKKKKLELLRERGLEVTAIPCAGWPPAPHPASAAGPLQRQLFARAQLLQMYGYGPPPPPPPPPRAAQAACPFGSAGATKTVYCDPRAPLMPAPHVILGAPPRAAPAAPTAPPARALDLTRPSPPPAPPKVEITLVNKWKGGNGNALEPYAALYGRLAAYRALAGQREKR